MSSRAPIGANGAKLQWDRLPPYPPGAGRALSGARRIALPGAAKESSADFKRAIAGFRSLRFRPMSPCSGCLPSCG